ncbi:MAG: glutamate ligase domain-containing protein, partial [Phycisphaerae bacterium]
HLEDIHPEDLVVLELSSAQLEDLPRIGWTPPVAVITNLSPHHLDRYGTYAVYLQAKLNIVPRRGGPQTMVVGDLDGPAREHLGRRFATDRMGMVRAGFPDPPVALSLPGTFHQRNAACVLAVCAQLGLSESAVRGALKSFPGLPHRMEPVRTLRGVTYYNDAKSTAPETTACALESLERPIIALVGGQARAGDTPLDRFGTALSRRCRLVVCLGESGPRFARAAREAGARDAGAGKPRADVEVVGEVGEALRLAHHRARPGDSVVFSPGAPSYDAYANFMQRGRQFVEGVRSLV